MTKLKESTFPFPSGARGHEIDLTLYQGFNHLQELVQNPIREQQQNTTKSFATKTFARDSICTIITTTTLPPWHESYVNVPNTPDMATVDAKVNDSIWLLKAATITVALSAQQADAAKDISRPAPFLILTGPCEQDWLSGPIHLPVKFDRALGTTFQRLAKAWKKEKQLLSSMSAIEESPHYLGIIALGKDVVPLLLKELECDPDYWFTALQTLTGEDPVPVDARGDLLRMTEHWLDWGRRTQRSV